MQFAASCCTHRLSLNTNAVRAVKTPAPRSAVLYMLGNKFPVCMKPSEAEQTCASLACTPSGVDADWPNAVAFISRTRTRTSVTEIQVILGWHNPLRRPMCAVQQPASSTQRWTDLQCVSPRRHACHAIQLAPSHRQRRSMAIDS